MDPRAVLIELLRALEQGDRENATESARSLTEWLDKGGFMPKVETLEGPSGSVILVGT